MGCYGLLDNRMYLVIKDISYICQGEKCNLSKIELTNVDQKSRF